jgi:hypothetical protein
MHASNMHRGENTIEAYTVNRFCDAFSLGRTYVYEQIKLKRLRAVKCGARTMILRQDAEAWANALPAMGGARKGG